MNLVDKYILKVTNTVTFNAEAEEIINEIKYLIEDSLNGDESPENVKKVLNELGDPRELALSYLGKSGSFIDAEWVPYYYRGLKTSFKISMLVTLIVHMILSLYLITSGSNIILSIIRVLPLYILVSPFVFSIVTLVFFLMSRAMTVEEYLSNSGGKSLKMTLTGTKDSSAQPIKSGSNWDVSQLNSYKYNEDFKSMYTSKSLKLNIIFQFINLALCIFLVVAQPFGPRFDVDIVVDKYIPFIVFSMTVFTILNVIITFKGKSGKDIYHKDIMVLTVVRSLARLTLLFIGLIMLKVFDLTDLISITDDFYMNPDLFFAGVYTITAIIQIVLTVHYLIGYKNNK